MVRAFTIEVEEVQGGWVAVLNRGGRLNPLPFGRKKLTAPDLDTLLKDIGETVKKAMGK